MPVNGIDARLYCATTLLNDRYSTRKSCITECLS